MAEYCERCKRPAPPWEAHEYSDWEATERADGSVGVLCPGCLTLEEENDIAADMEQLAVDAEELRRREGGES